MLPALSPSLPSLPHWRSAATAESSARSVLHEQALWRCSRLGSHQEARQAKQTKSSLYLRCANRKKRNFLLQRNDFRIFVLRRILQLAVQELQELTRKVRHLSAMYFLEWKHRLEKLRQLGGGGSQHWSILTVMYTVLLHVLSTRPTVSDPLSLWCLSLLLHQVVLFHRSSSEVPLQTPTVNIYSAQGQWEGHTDVFKQKANPNFSHVLIILLKASGQVNHKHSLIIIKTRDWLERNDCTSGIKRETRNKEWNLWRMLAPRSGWTDRLTDGQTLNSDALSPGVVS